MDLSDAIRAWCDAWSPPDIDPGTAHKIRDDFCRENPSLAAIDTNELAAILTSKADRWLPQLFVANLLSRHDRFDTALMIPMLRAAIDNPDPSSNRDFLTPCLQSFGSESVVKWLADAFRRGSLLDRLGVANLVYWLHSTPVDIFELRRRKANGIPVDQWLASHLIDSTELTCLIAGSAMATDHLIERYFYRQALPDHPELFTGVPADAMELERAIAGDPDYERLLYDELQWQRPTEIHNDG